MEAGRRTKARTKRRTEGRMMEVKRRIGREGVRDGGRTTINLRTTGRRRTTVTGGRGAEAGAELPRGGRALPVVRSVEEATCGSVSRGLMVAPIEGNVIASTVWHTVAKILAGNFLLFRAGHRDVRTTIAGTGTAVRGAMGTAAAIGGGGTTTGTEIGTEIKAETGTEIGAGIEEMIETEMMGGGGRSRSDRGTTIRAEAKKKAMEAAPQETSRRTRNRKLRRPLGEDELRRGRRARRPSASAAGRDRVLVRIPTRVPLPLALLRRVRPSLPRAHPIASLRPRPTPRPGPSRGPSRDPLRPSQSQSRSRGPGPDRNRVRVRGRDRDRVLGHEAGRGQSHEYAIGDQDWWMAARISVLETSSRDERILWNDGNGR
jgi:hypothetical protein